MKEIDGVGAFALIGPADFLIKHIQKRIIFQLTAL